MHAGKTRPRAARGGRERPHRAFGRLKAVKSGVLPPNLVIFSVSLFFISCLLFPRFPETYEIHKEKKMVKTKLKYVISTFFTCFPEILAAHACTEKVFFLGWSDPRVTLGTEPCPKVGSLQPNKVFCPRPNLSSHQTQPLVPWALARSLK